MSDIYYYYYYFYYYRHRGEAQETGSAEALKKPRKASPKKKTAAVKIEEVQDLTSGSEDSVSEITTSSKRFCKPIFVKEEFFSQENLAILTTLFLLGSKARLLGWR